MALVPTASTTPVRTTSRRSRPTPISSSIPRTALNVFYVGFTNTAAPFDNEKVRQAIAQGIDRKRIVDNFYPPGSEVASHFTPCDIAGGCSGDEWYAYDPAAAKALLAEAGFPDGFTTKLHLRDVVRGYLPSPVTVAQDIQAQLKANLNITAEIDVQDATTYLTTASRGELTGIHLLGWGADYPDVTNFLDVHFGVGASDQFGTKFDDITAPLVEGGKTADPAARAELYKTANDAIKLHVPMVPIAHGGSATVFKADVVGGHSSPLGNEALFAMKAGDRDTLIWLQNGEPGGLYCADETDGESLRVCEQVLEPLYSYKIGGTDPEPAPCDRLRGQRRLKPLDLHPAGRCDVPQRRHVRRQRRRHDVRRPVGRRASTPQGTGGPVRVLDLPVRRVPEPAASGAVTQARYEGAPRLWRPFTPSGPV